MLTIAKAKQEVKKNFYLSILFFILGVTLVATLLVFTIIKALVFFGATDLLNTYFLEIIQLIINISFLGWLYLALDTESASVFLVILFFIASLWIFTFYFNEKRKYFKKLIQNIAHENRQTELSEDNQKINHGIQSKTNISNKNGQVNVTNVINNSNNEPSFKILALGIASTTIGGLLVFYISKNI